MLLFGSRDQYLRLIRDALGVRIIARGDVVHIEGTETQVEQADRVFQQLRLMLQKQGSLSSENVRTVLAIVQQGRRSPGRRKTWPSPTATATSGRAPTARLATSSAMQRQRPDLLHRPGRHRQDLSGRRHGRQPAAPGRGQDASCWCGRRSRPANGSGFLPGDIVAKINPYLRPLSTPSTT